VTGLQVDVALKHQSLVVGLDQLRFVGNAMEIKEGMEEMSSFNLSIVANILNFHAMAKSLNTRVLWGQACLITSQFREMDGKYQDVSVFCSLTTKTSATRGTYPFLKFAKKLRASDIIYGLYLSSQVAVFMDDYEKAVEEDDREALKNLDFEVYWSEADNRKETKKYQDLIEEFPGYLLPLPNFIKWVYSGTKRKNFEYKIVPAVKYCLLLKDVSIQELYKSIDEKLMTVTSEGEFRGLWYRKEGWS